MGFGLQGGAPSREAGADHRARSRRPPGEACRCWSWCCSAALPSTASGAFTLTLKNKTTGDYTKKDAPLVGNLIFAGIAGAIWCSQFICFKTGEPQMGQMAYIGWAVLMASAILFSTLLGIFLGEWKGTSGRTQRLAGAGFGVAARLDCRRRLQRQAQPGRKPAAPALPCRHQPPDRATHHAPRTTLSSTTQPSSLTYASHLSRH